LQYLELLFLQRQHGYHGWNSFGSATQ
jgi:hypothetical protein